MSNDRLIFYHVSNDYINFLRKYEPKVLFNKAEDNTRPYVGFVLRINGMKYLIPLSSRIRKSNKVTTSIPNNYTKVQKLENPNLPEKIATIKFNSMIPVFDDIVQEINLDNYLHNKKDRQYRDLLIKEIIFCSENKENIIKKANNTFKIYHEKQHYLKQIIKSCCDFELLEEKCLEYQENARVFEEIATTKE